MQVTSKITLSEVINYFMVLFQARSICSDGADMRSLAVQVPLDFVYSLRLLLEIMNYIANSLK
jgi:hypothetical protein